VRSITNSIKVLFVRKENLLILEHVEYKINTALKTLTNIIYDFKFYNLGTVCSEVIVVEENLLISYRISHPKRKIPIILS